MPATAETQPHELAYRADIDGLRAISVGLVMVFHMAAAAMPGGFVGVDVFFVISGYLISGLILKALQTGSFSLIDFYVRRVRRIAPALFVMIALTIAAGCIVLMPSDLREAARSGLYAVFGASNFYFLRNTGYFDITAEMLPLLHTWSLGVEEQFYLAWPLFLALLFKLTQGNRRRMAAVVAMVVAVSFAACQWMLQHNPKYAFYLPVTRAWQLGLGALLIFLPQLPRAAVSRIAAQVLPLAGLALVLAAGLLLKQGVPYPGVNALMPAVGAALVLYDGGGVSIARWLLSLSPMVFLGKISYSLYLWHWPILVLWRHLINGEKVTTFEVAILAALSIMVATLSWRFVETPARRGKLMPAFVFSRASVAAGIIGVAATAIVQLDGLPNRISSEARAMSGLDVMWNWTCPQTVALPIVRFDNPSQTGSYCAFGADWGKANRRALLWGDSNAEHFTVLLHQAGLKTDTAFVLINPCPPIITPRTGRAYPDLPAYTAQCAAQRTSVIAYLKNAADITHVVLAARWSNLHDVLRDETLATGAAVTTTGLQRLERGLADLLPQVMAPHRRVIVVNDIPHVPIVDPAACVMSRIGLPRARTCTYDLDTMTDQAVKATQKGAHDVVRKVGAEFPGAIVINPENSMCREGRCPLVVADEFIYRDSIHFRRNLKPATNDKLIEMLGFADMLSQPIPASAQN